MLTRRHALTMFGVSGLSGLALSCRQRPTDADGLIRAWFRERRLPEPSPVDIEAVRAYLSRQPLAEDPSLQPGLLFNPEVDLG